MSATASVQKNIEPNSATTAGRLFFLDLSGGRILSTDSDGSDLTKDHHQRRPEVAGRPVRSISPPDTIYWTNMGDPVPE